MVNLRNPKLAGKLRRHTNLHPMPRNETRWISTFKMLESFYQLRTFPDNFDFTEDKNFLDYLPTAKEVAKLKKLATPFKKFNSVQMLLQSEDVTRAVFDSLRTRRN